MSNTLEIRAAFGSDTCSHQDCKANSTTAMIGTSAKGENVSLQSCDLHVNEVNDQFRVAMGKKKRAGDYGRSKLTPAEVEIEKKLRAEENYAKNVAKKAIEGREDQQEREAAAWLRQRHTELNF